MSTAISEFSPTDKKPIPSPEYHFSRRQRQFWKNTKIKSPMFAELLKT